jgi:hypothetical protein
MAYGMGVFQKVYFQERSCTRLALGKEGSTSPVYFQVGTVEPP